VAKPLLPDELWERIEPLLPIPKPRRFRYPGRKPVQDRKALIGILFVLTRQGRNQKGPVRAPRTLRDSQLLIQFHLLFTRVLRLA
jgi:hypothetical protein